MSTKEAREIVKTACCPFLAAHFSTDSHVCGQLLQQSFLDRDRTSPSTLIRHLVDLYVKFRSQIAAQSSTHTD